MLRGRIVINAAQVTGRELVIAIEPGVATLAQRQAIKQVISYGLVEGPQRSDQDVEVVVSVSSDRVVEAYEIQGRLVFASFNSRSGPRFGHRTGFLLAPDVIPRKSDVDRRSAGVSCAG